MSNLIYLKLIGDKQGLLSADCSRINTTDSKYRLSHDNEIVILKLINTLSRDENDTLRHIDIIKSIDKSTPLLANALNKKEKLFCEFLFYRTVDYGRNELYFKLILKDAILTDIRFVYPNSMINEDCSPQESVSFAYSTIAFEHIKGQTRPPTSRRKSHALE